MSNTANLTAFSKLYLAYVLFKKNHPHKQNRRQILWILPPWVEVGGKPTYEVYFLAYFLEKLLNNLSSIIKQEQHTQKSWKNTKLNGIRAVPRGFNPN
jgi:hypothetical protein